eukprot:2133619-Alexandrium_andersonii.AAC.1
MQRRPLRRRILAPSPQSALHRLDVLRHGLLLVVVAALDAAPQPRALAARGRLFRSGWPSKRPSRWLRGVL